MTKYEELFHKIAADLPDSQEGKLFGALCVKAANGKAGAMFWKDDMIFKLAGAHQEEALSLTGAKMFDPMGGRPMNGWVHVPNTHCAKWKKYSEIAMDEVKNIDVEKKAKKPKK